MKQLLPIIAVSLSSSVSGLGIMKCGDPPMPQEEFLKLEVSISKVLPSSDKLNIYSVEHCDGKEFQSATIYYEPHVVQEPYEAFYRLACSHKVGEPWDCSQLSTLGHLTYQGGKVKLWGGISRQEAIDIVAFIETLEVKSFDEAFEFGSPVSSEELEKYKEIYAISKRGNFFEVTVPGGKHGNTIQVQRIECGLKQCDFKVKSLLWQLD